MDKDFKENTSVPLTQPDILIKYPASELDRVLTDSEWEYTAYSMIYVRPETNLIKYEGRIIEGLKKFANIIYMANFNGDVFSSHNILKEHNSSQFRFSDSPREEMGKYSELIDEFEKYFNISYDKVKILGGFSALTELNISEEELFEIIVPETEFLRLYGQTFKKVEDVYIVNYDLPAILKRYNAITNVFMVLVKSDKATPTFFEDLNLSIYNEIASSGDTPILFGDKLEDLDWSEKIKRTYHLSNNHLMTMFDMSHFIFKDKDKRLDITETPLGKTILANKIFTEEQLRILKTLQLCYSYKNGKKILHYLPYAGKNKSYAWIIDMLENVRL